MKLQDNQLRGIIFHVEDHLKHEGKWSKLPILSSIIPLSSIFFFLQPQLWRYRGTSIFIFYHPQHSLTSNPFSCPHVHPSTRSFSTIGSSVNISLFILSWFTTISTWVMHSKTPYISSILMLSNLSLIVWSWTCFNRPSLLYAFSKMFHAFFWSF